MQEQPARHMERCMALYQRNAVLQFAERQQRGVPHNSLPHLLDLPEKECSEVREVPLPSLFIQRHTSLRGVVNGGSALWGGPEQIYCQGFLHKGPCHCHNRSRWGALPFTQCDLTPRFTQPLVQTKLSGHRLFIGAFSFSHTHSPGIPTRSL